MAFVERSLRNKTDAKKNEPLMQKLSPVRLDELNHQINRSVGHPVANSPSSPSKGSGHLQDSSESDDRDVPVVKDTFFLRKRSSPWEEPTAKPVTQVRENSSRKAIDFFSKHTKNRRRRHVNLDEDMPTGPAVHLFSLQSYLHCQIVPELPSHLVVSPEYSRFVYSRWLVLSNRIEWGMKYKPFKYGELPPPVGSLRLKGWLLDYFKRNRAGNAKPVLIKGKPGIGKTAAIESICVSDGYLLEHVDCCLFKNMADIKKKYHEAVKSSSVRMTQRLSSPSAWNPDQALAPTIDRPSETPAQQPSMVSRVFLLHNLHHILQQEEDPNSVLNFFKNGHFPVLIEVSTSAPDNMLGVLKEVDYLTFDAPDPQQVAGFLLEMTRVEMMGLNLMLKGSGTRSKILDEIEEASSSSNSQDRVKEVAIELPDVYNLQNRPSQSGSHNSLRSSNDPTPQFGIQFAPFLPGSPEAVVNEEALDESETPKKRKPDDEDSIMSFQARPRRRNKDLYLSSSESDSDQKYNPDSTATNPKQDPDQVAAGGNSDVSESYKSDITGSETNKAIAAACWKLPWVQFQTGSIIENHNYRLLVEKTLNAFVQLIGDQQTQDKPPFCISSLIALLDYCEGNLHAVYSYLKSVTLQVASNFGLFPLPIIADIRTFSSGVYFNKRPLMPTSTRSWHLSSSAASEPNPSFQQSRIPVSAELLLTVPGIVSSNQMIDVSEIICTMGGSPNRGNQRQVINSGFPTQYAFKLSKILGAGRKSDHERVYGGMNISDREASESAGSGQTESASHNTLSHYWSNNNNGNPASKAAASEWQRLQNRKCEDIEAYRKVFLNQMLSIPKQNCEVYLTEKSAVDRVIYEDYLSQMVDLEAKKKGAVKIKDPELFTFLNCVKGLGGRSALNRFLCSEFSPDILRHVDERIQIYNKVMDNNPNIDEIRKLQQARQIIVPKQTALVEIVALKSKEDSYSSYQAKMATNPWLSKQQVPRGSMEPIRVDDKSQAPQMSSMFRTQVLDRVSPPVVQKPSSLQNFFKPTPPAPVTSTVKPIPEAVEKPQPIKVVDEVPIVSEGKNKFNRKPLLYEQTEEEDTTHSPKISHQRDLKPVLTKIPELEPIPEVIQPKSSSSKSQIIAEIPRIAKSAKPSQEPSKRMIEQMGSDSKAAKKKSIFQSEEEDSVGMKKPQKRGESGNPKPTSSTLADSEFKIRIRDSTDPDESEDNYRRDESSESEERPVSRSRGTDVSPILSNRNIATRSKPISFSNQPKRHSKELIKVYEIESSPVADEKSPNSKPTKYAEEMSVSDKHQRVLFTKKPLPFRNTESESMSVPDRERRSRGRSNHRETEESGVSRLSEGTRSSVDPQTHALVREYSKLVLKKPIPGVLVGSGISASSPRVLITSVKTATNHQQRTTVTREDDHSPSGLEPDAVISLLNDKLGMIDGGKRARRHSQTGLRRRPN